MFTLLRSLILCLVVAACTALMPATGISAASPPQVMFLSALSEGLSTPQRIAADSAGALYVTDPRAAGVVRFDASGRFLGIVPTTKGPLGIAATSDGKLVVSMGDRVDVLDLTGRRLGSLGKGAGQFKMANGIAIDPAGLLYVVDSLDDCIQVFTSSGAPVIMSSASPGKPANSFGSTGALAGQFLVPGGITYEKAGTSLAVADTGNGRIQFFSLSGQFQRSIGSQGTVAPGFAAPRSVSFEYAKGGLPSVARMYVTDSFQSTVQVIDPAGSGISLGFIGRYGTRPGELINPSDALFDQVNDRLLVVNGYGNLSFYGINGGGTTPPDTTPPVVAMNPVPLFTNVNTVSVSGTVELGAIVTVNGVPATVSGTAWSREVTGLLSGANAVTVVATDPAGNKSSLSATITFDAGSTQFTVNQAVSPTNAPVQTLSGTVEAGGTVAVINNTTSTSGIATVSGTSWTYSAVLFDGTNNFTVTASKTGKNSASANLDLTLVRTRPILTVSALKDGSITRTGLVTVTGTVVVTPYFQRVTVNGREVSVIDGLFSAVVPLQPGDNAITVTASDRAGNTSSDTRSIRFDRSAPSVAIIAPPDGSITAATAVTVTGTADPLCTVTVKVNGVTIGAVSAASWSLPVQLDSGLEINTIEAIVTDRQGAVSSAKSTVIVDAGRPGLVVTSPATDRYSASGHFTLDGTFSAAGTPRIAVTVNGTTVPVTVNGQSYTVQADVIAEGAYTVAITVTGSGGNSATTFRTIVFDATPPLLSLVTQPGASLPTTITGTVEPGSTLSISDRNGPVGSFSVVNGIWTANIPGGYDPAVIDIVAVDPAGNRSRSGALVTVGGPTSIADAVRALWFSTGFGIPTLTDLLHGDVAPLVNGVPVPDGKIDVGDALIILRKVVGLISF